VKTEVWLDFLPDGRVVVIVNDWLVFLYILFRHVSHKAVTVLFVREVTLSYALHLYTCAT
jgi:hypothetical protein